MRRELLLAITLLFPLSGCGALTQHEQAYAALAPADQAKIESLGNSIFQLAKAVADMRPAEIAAATANTGASAWSAAGIIDPNTGEAIGIVGAVSLVISYLVTRLRHKITPADPRVQKKAG